MEQRRCWPVPEPSGHAKPCGRVVIVSGSVGAGHDGVAHELARRLGAAGHEVDVLDMLLGFPLFIRFLLGGGYLFTVKAAPPLYDLACWLVERSRLFQRLADAVCESAIPWLIPRLRSADVVVATYPPAGRALGSMRAAGLLAVPAVTYLTDPAPNYLWVHPAVDLHLTASSSTAQETRERYGVDVETGGPLVASEFRTVDRRTARADLRRSLGLSPETRVALLLLGSLGIGDVRAALGALETAGFTPVVLCGRNNRRQRRLRRRRAGVRALGWRDDVPSLIAGSDLVVHNAGGLSLTESLVVGVPAITFAALPGHGRANARSLARSGAVPWARSPAELTALAGADMTTAAMPWPVEEETAAGRIATLALATLGHA